MNSAEIFDYTVYDRNDDKVGKVENIWTDASGTLRFIGISTGWLGMGRNHVLPACDVTVNTADETVRVPYDEATIKRSPSYDHTTDLTDLEEGRLCTHFSVSAQTADAGRGCGTEKAARTVESFFAGKSVDAGKSVEVPLAEETVHVGKREESLGEVRLRKVVRTEIVNQPVELRREEVIVERVSGKGGTPGSEAFVEEVVSIPISQEKAVVQKSVQSAGSVKATKQATSRMENVSETVRKEDVEVERDLAAAK